MDKGEKLKTLIVDKYGSIREFAKAVNIPSTTLTSALDKGIGGMAVDRVIKICEILDVDVKTFEPLHHIKETSANLQEKSLLNHFNKLNNTGKDEAVKRVEELTHFNKYTNEEDYLMPIAAHNDHPLTDEELELMRQDLEDM